MTLEVGVGVGNSILRIIRPLKVFYHYQGSTLRCSGTYPLNLLSCLLQFQESLEVFSEKILPVELEMGFGLFEETMLIIETGGEKTSI